MYREPSPLIIDFPMVMYTALSHVGCQCVLRVSPHQTARNGRQEYCLFAKDDVFNLFKVDLWHLDIT